MRRTVAVISVKLALIVWCFRTRQLARQMSAMLALRDRHQALEDRFVRELPLQQPEEVKYGIRRENFVSTIEQIDGMTESLRVLLNGVLLQEDNSTTGNSATQREDDEARCRRYGFTLSHPFRRRRIFWGSLLADDSWHVLSLAAMEFQGLIHTIAFVESNTTQTRTPRDLRYPPHSKRLQLLTSPLLWGDQTRVHVDYYVDQPEHAAKKSLWRENDQRNRIFERWRQNGMRDDDIGYISDIDEVATRDFLRALQVCNVPEFTPNQIATNVTARNKTAMYHDCLQPKLSSSTVVYEGSPMCMQVPRRLGRPDWAIGECIQGIGDATKHPPIQRTDKSGTLERFKNWSKSLVQGANGTPINGPLWDATDFRMISSRRVAGTTSGGIPHMLPTAYHFHNFFDSLSVLRRKYQTYGHPKAGALELPLGDIQRNDLGFLVDCLTGRSSSRSKWRQPGPSDWSLMDTTYGTPLAFQKLPAYVQLRHQEFQNELVRDEALHPPNITTGST